MTLRVFQAGSESLFDGVFCFFVGGDGGLEAWLTFFVCNVKREVVQHHAV